MTKIRMLLQCSVVFVLGGFGVYGVGAQACLAHAARQYQVPEALLHAIAEQESSKRANAINHNRNGTKDIGLMQINSSWVPMLQRHGLREEDLWDPCVNALVAAWLLSQNFKRWGYTYRALGAYHSPDMVRQLNYANQILKRLNRQSPTASPNAISQMTTTP